MGNKRKIESEIDFKSLLKNPIRLFGLVYIYFFVIALTIGIYYVYNMDVISFNTVPGTSLDTLNIVREIDKKVGEAKPSMDLSLVMNPTEEFMALGKTKYETMCGSCHGADGKGDGVAAVALDPKPRNFHSIAGWTVGVSFYEIYKSIHEGIPGTGMMAYEFLPPEDRVAMIHYIRTMADYPEVTIADNEKLDETFNLSAGIVDPNNIPIKTSFSLLSEENLEKIELTNSITEKIINDTGADATLFKNNVQNIEKVVYTHILKLHKKSFENFVQILSFDPVALGYRASVVNLVDEDLKTIYAYLKQVNN